MGSYPAVLWLSVLAALLGSFQFGYCLGVLNTCLDWMADDLGFQVARGGSVVVSSALIGASVGSITAGQFADSVGPGKALLYNNFLLLLGSVLCAATPGGMFAAIVGRFLVGSGAGAASLYVPRYLSEIAPVVIRGGISTLNQVFICVGILVAYLVGLPYSDNQAAVLPLGSGEVAWWRVMLAIGIIPAASQMVAMSVLPESPVWLRWKGRSVEAGRAAKRLLGSQWEAEEVMDAPYEREEQEPLVSAFAHEAQQAAETREKGWLDLLNPRYRWIMLLTTMLPLFQQLSGINTCILYSSEVFKKAGLKSPVLGSIIMGCINLGGTLTAVFLMDRAGRRRLILVSHGGMAFCLLLISVVAFIPGAENLQAVVSFGALLVFVLFFGLGAGPITWIYLPEVLPDEIKGRGASLGTCLNWVATFLVGLSFPVMLRLLDVGGSYLVYGVLNIAALAFCWVYMVETKQQSLAHIQKLLLLEI